MYSRLGAALLGITISACGDGHKLVNSVEDNNSNLPVIPVELVDRCDPEPLDPNEIDVITRCIAELIEIGYSEKAGLGNETGITQPIKSGPNLKYYARAALQQSIDLGCFPHQEMVCGAANILNLSSFENFSQDDVLYATCTDDQTNAIIFNVAINFGEIVGENHIIHLPEVVADKDKLKFLCEEIPNAYVAWATLQKE